MSTKVKKPDHIVWDEENQKYHANILPYGSSVSAPVIKIEDISSYKQRNVQKSCEAIKDAGLLDDLKSPVSQQAIAFVFDGLAARQPQAADAFTKGALSARVGLGEGGENHQLDPSTLLIGRTTISQMFSNGARCFSLGSTRSRHRGSSDGNARSTRQAQKRRI